MNLDLLPSPGTFIRPVGSGLYCYCYRVLENVSSRELSFPRFECERWGMTDKCPVDDGHRLAGHYLYLLPVRPGVWSVPFFSFLSQKRCFSEIYYLDMRFSPRGQGVLF